VTPRLLPEFLTARILHVERSLEFANMEVFVVNDHEHQAQEEGAGDSYEDLVTVPADHASGDLLTQGPEGHQQDVLHQHDGVEGDDL